MDFEPRVKLELEQAVNGGWLVCQIDRADDGERLRLPLAAFSSSMEMIVWLTKTAGIVDNHRDQIIAARAKAKAEEDEALKQRIKRAEETLAEAQNAADEPQDWLGKAAAREAARTPQEPE